MGTHALFAPSLVAVSHRGDDDAEHEDPVIFNLWPPVRVTPVLNPPPAFATTSAGNAAETLAVSVSPPSPAPSDLVSIAISTEASQSKLVLDRTTVDKQGGAIAIDLYWSGPTPAAVRAGEEVEITETLGTFRPGLYHVRVRSHGAIVGEGATLFNVRAPAPAAGGAFSRLQSVR